MMAPTVDRVMARVEVAMPERAEPPEHLAAHSEGPEGETDEHSGEHGE